jgi:hypothetical protein
MVVVSDPSSHNTQFPTDVGAKGAVYDMFTVFTLEMVLLHMFCRALTVNTDSVNVKLELPYNPVPPVATVNTLLHPVDPVIVTEPPLIPAPGGPVGPVTEAPVTPVGPVGPVAPSTP